MMLAAGHHHHFAETKLSIRKTLQQRCPRGM
jgi:hypothetical protein